MPITDRSHRRALPTPALRWVARLGVVLLLGAVLSLPVGVGATPGTDDYPGRLKIAAQDALVDPWLFYNRECTSFVAWRLNHDAGIAFTNQYDGHHWGDAAIWKKAAVDSGVLVDSSPRLGAVAWWAKGSPGSSRGHVAWVLAVDGSSITVEEYNYLHAGRYDQRTISTSSSSWPSAFIHVGDVDVQNTALPTVTGAAQVGVKLKASPGTWSPSDATYSYQWYAAGSPVAGATRRGFTPGAEQLGKRIRVQVTATATGGQTGVAKSAATAATAPGDLGLTAPPTVTGTPQVGLQLSATTGTWSTSATYSFQWQDDQGPIPGATDSTFTPSAAQLGRPLQVVVTATRDGYSTEQSTSVATAAVQPGTIDVQAMPTITGDAQVDQTLVAKAGSWSPAAEPAFQWLVDGAPVAGATGDSYTPSAADLRKQVSVQISLSEPGYAPVTEVSAATSEVVPGTFRSTSEPAVTGTPKVGQALTADPGGWSPEPTLSWQWTANGTPVPGATGSKFTPSPAELGKKLAVVVTAQRPGYLTAVVQSPATQSVLPGTNAVVDPPVISGGVAQVGRALTATSGTWAVTPSSIAYQWYASGVAIQGATSSSFTPSDAQLDQALTVQVTVQAAGYASQTASSAVTPAVVLGQAAFASAPVTSGSALVGQTLEVTATATPAEATATYEWLRDGAAIKGADGPSYTLRSGDVGHRIAARVTAAAPHWASFSQTSRHVRVRTIPRLTTKVADHGTRADLSVRVATPGLPDSQGTLRVYEHRRLLDSVAVTDHRARIRLRHLSAGTHRLVLRYRGPGPQIAASARVTF